MTEILRRDTYLTDPLIPLRVISAVVSKPSEPNHRHEFTEMVLVMSGRGRHRYGGRMYPIEAGDMFVVEPGQTHRYFPDGSVSVKVVIYDEEFFLSFAPGLRHLSGYHGFFHLEPRMRENDGFSGKIRFNPEELAGVADRLEEIAGEVGDTPLGYSMKAAGLFTAVLTDACRTFSAMATPAARRLLGVGDVVSLLEYRYSEQWSLRRLASISAFSESTLLRHFKRATGTTPLDYLSMVRLRNTRRLLTESDSTVTRIAAEVGFNDVNYLCRVFKRATGMSPGYYRRVMGRQSASGAKRIDEAGR